MTKSLKVQIAEQIRDSSHNLVITEKNELDNEVYFSRLKYFIGELEGVRNEAYLDGIPDPKNPTKFISAEKFYSLSEEKREELLNQYTEANSENKKFVTTVGIGANIEQDQIKERFNKILGKPGLMHLVYYGKAELTDEQVAIIFRDCISTRVDELRRIYKSDWDKLRVNERISIISLYFNHKNLAGGHTNFYKYITNYIKTGDLAYLKQAVNEVKERSNPKRVLGIQNRRDAEAELLASYKSSA
eukprot:GHVL01036695.1.p1 GENE.GHVL01036695.1~~GHVL01036695.1.p1  ORF type:complete len:245 (+),score=25.90 GHVL01036695.1:183-917(+)